VRPFLAAVLYLIVRGQGMAERSVRRQQAAQADDDRYIQQVAGRRSPAAQIAHAKELRDTGEVSAAEFASLKARR
jgi:hypothetical protein